MTSLSLILLSWPLAGLLAYILAVVNDFFTEHGRTYLSYTTEEVIDDAKMSMIMGYLALYVIIEIIVKQEVRK